MPAKAPRVRMRGISKRYGTIQTLADVSLDLAPGEVLGLVGDNGAGKSTLSKVLSGAVVPDGGTIEIDGTAVSFASPADARGHRVEMVYQDLSLCDTVDVAGNLFLGREPRRPGLLGRLGLVDKSRMRSESSQFFDELGSRVGSVRRPVEVLSGGQRQAVAIARASARATAGGAGVVLMDEPMAALGVEQSQRVVELIQRLAERRILVILISHNLPLCFEIADRMLVMRHGALVADVVPEETSLERAVSLITGAEGGLIRAR
jgi:simple sugar transport system ATP-binding protein